MSVYIGDVETFAGVIADKPQVLKIGEETMEVFSAWEDYKDCSYSQALHKEALVAEIADVIQAACNLLAAVGVDDMRQPMQACYVRNKERGREYSSRDDMDSAVYVQNCLNESCRQYANQVERADLPDCGSDSREQIAHDAPDEFAAWFDAEHVEPNDGIKTENDVTVQSADANDNTEQAEEDRNESLSDLLKQIDNVSDEGLAYLSKWHLPSVISLLRDYEDEKLMRDCDLETQVLLSTEELQEQVDNQKKSAENFRDMWQKADTRCSELKAENDGLKARIESLRSKLSKMLDAASAIQHIGDLP